MAMKKKVAGRQIWAVRSPRLASDRPVHHEINLNLLRNLKEWSTVDPVSQNMSYLSERILGPK